MADNGSTCCTVTCHDVQHTFGQATLRRDLGKGQRGQRRIFGGFQDDGVPCGQRGCDFPCEHQQWEVPRDHLTADTHGIHVREFVCQNFSPARMVVEMTSDQRDVDIAAFADRFAVVDGFQDGEEPCVLLDVTCQGVEVFGAFMARQFRPLWLGLVRGGNGFVHVGVGALGHVGNDIARCGVGHGKGFA